MQGGVTNSVCRYKFNLKQSSTQNGTSALSAATPWHTNLACHFLGGSGYPDFTGIQFLPWHRSDGRNFTSPPSLKSSGTCHRFQKIARPFTACSAARTCAVHARLWSHSQAPTVRMPGAERSEASCARIAGLWDRWVSDY